MSATTQLRALPPSAPASNAPASSGQRVVTLDLDNAAQVHHQLMVFRDECLKSGVDYGVIPSTPRTTLYKPGAEKLMHFFGLSLTLEITSRLENWDKDQFAYEVKATLRSKRSGQIEAEGLGNCNNKERKYKNQDGPNVANTLLKMAKKRALIDAVLTATRSSGLFEDEDARDTEPRAARPASQSPQASPSPKEVTITPSQWERCERARKRAIELGYRTRSGEERNPVRQNELVKVAGPLCEKWEKFVREGEILLSEALGEETAAQSIETQSIEAQPLPVDDQARYKIPANAPSKTCTCGAKVYFAPTKKGGQMPCDAVEAVDATRGGWGTPHFVTCPDAGQHRKPRTPAKHEKPHLARIWATISELGLPSHNAPGPQRDARLQALNRFFLDHEIAPVESFNQIAPAQTQLVVGGLRAGALTWN